MKSIQLPEAQLEALVQRVSDKLLQAHPLPDGHITGEQLKQFASHKQVNKFLLFQIFQIWQQQVAQFKHPFFDFSDPEIKGILEQLENRLSLHVKIPADDFTPLLQRAVASNLNLLLQPAATLDTFLFSEEDHISLQELQQHSAFFSDWDFAINSILRYYQKHPEETITRESFAEKLQRVLQKYEQVKQQPVSAYQQQAFASLTGESLREIEAKIEAAKAEAEAKRRAEEEAKRQAEAEARRKEEEARRAEEESRRQAEEAERRRREEEARKKNLFADLREEPTDTLDLDAFDDNDASTPDAAATEAPEPAAEPEPAPMPAPAPETVTEPTPEPPAPEPEPVADVPPEAQPSASQTQDEDNEFLEMAANMEPQDANAPRTENGSYLDRFRAEPEETTPESEEEKPASILDKIQERSQTVADRFSEQTKQRKLHESLNGNRKIKLDEIPIHKQYQYVQKVFGGNNVRFRIIVDRVNDARDAGEVEDILNKFVLSIDELDREDAVVQEFVQLLRNRF